MSRAGDALTLKRTVPAITNGFMTNVPSAARRTVGIVSGAGRRFCCEPEVSFEPRAGASAPCARAAPPINTSPLAQNAPAATR